MTLDREVAEQVRCLRRRRGLTQGELAEKLGMHSQAISRFERGYCTLGILHRIAAALEVEIDVRLIPRENL